MAKDCCQWLGRVKEVRAEDNGQLIIDGQVVSSQILVSCAGCSTVLIAVNIVQCGAGIVFELGREGC